MASVCLRGERDAEQIEGAALGLGGGGKDGGEAIAPKADDIAGERGEIAKQGMETVHREWFALCRVSAFANGLALRRRRGLGLGHRRDALRLAGPPLASATSPTQFSQLIATTRLFECRRRRPLPRTASSCATPGGGWRRHISKIRRCSPAHDGVVGNLLALPKGDLQRQLNCAGSEPVRRNPGGGPARPERC